MKKIFFVALLTGISFAAFSQIEAKHVTGKWNYAVDTGSEIWKGVIKILENEGKLTGQVETNEGYTIPFSKIELKPENVMYMEIQTDSDVIKITVNVEGNKFKGTGSSYQGEAPITAEKVE